MDNYTDEEKLIDFNYFKSINISFFEKYGHKFIAVKKQKILDFDDSITNLISKMTSKGYSVGSYLIQECKGTELDYTNTVMRLMINA